MACGFAIEFWVTILTVRFTAFAMLFIIIYQVSVVPFPHDLQVSFYRYGVAVPFYRLSNMYRTLVFDTRNRLGEGFGVLLAWVVLSALITMPLITWFFRRREVAHFEKERAEQREKS